VTPREIARRYAEALYAASDGRDADRMVEELADVGAALADVPRLRRWIEHPLVARSEKQSFLRVAFPAASESTARTLALLVQNGRERLVRLVAEEFSAVCAEREGLVPISVATARPLDEEERRRLRERLEQTMGRPVRLDERVDPNLLAGVRLETQGRVLDGTARGTLERLRAALSEGGEG
jgi:F-type H+-transporting ATPase subunit delta